MRMMEQFREKIAGLGEIRRVWMTSFNISIDFVETHILPAVLGMDPPRNRMDYETLQLALSDKGIDFRVYCDKRMLKADQNKRTAMSVIPVSVGVLPGFSGKDRNRSLFHPKVIYLEDERGNMVLGAGSANLTVSGWGRNQEVFDFREVSNNHQYQQIKAFFGAIDASTELGIRRQFYGEDNDWQFVHTFDEYTFLDYLMDYGDIRELTVWSPYLADDLPAFVTKLDKYLEQDGKLKVSLVPDRLEGRYIRTPWGSEIGQLVEAGRLEFCDNPTKRHEGCELTHAKVWMVKGAEGTGMAIGSWNFTAPGSSSLAGDDGNNGWSNVEAGIVHSCNQLPRITGPAFVPTAEDFASREMLGKEELDVPDALPFDLSVVFDWEASAYQVTGQWHEGRAEEGYELKLPGVAETTPLAWGRNKGALKALEHHVSDDVALLTEHFYQIRHQGETIYQGLILEQGQRFRRTQGYGSLQELLDSYVSGVTPEMDDNVGLREVLKGQGEDDVPLSDVIASDRRLSISYFRLFYAMKAYRDRLDAINDNDELHKWLFTYPGCLQELVEQVSRHIEASTAVAFNWFLAHEVNTLYHRALARYDELRPLYSRREPPDHQWRKLHMATPELPEGDGRRERYIETIIRECGYVAE